MQRGNNTTKVGGNTNSREVASQLAAQARAAVDCPTLQCVGPTSINQAVKAVAIARTYLFQSDQSGSSSHPDLTVYPEFVKLDGQQIGREEQLSAVQLVISKRTRRPSVDKEGRSLKVSKDTEACKSPQLLPLFCRELLTTEVVHFVLGNSSDYLLESAGLLL